jgi:hypothetical protein
MIEYRDMLVAILDNVSRLKSSGMSLEQHPIKWNHLIG